MEVPTNPARRSFCSTCSGRLMARSPPRADAVFFLAITLAVAIGWWSAGGGAGASFGVGFSTTRSRQLGCSPPHLRWVSVAEGLAPARVRTTAEAHATRNTFDNLPSGLGWSVRLMRFRPSALARYSATSESSSSVSNVCSAFTLVDTPPLTVALT